MNSSVQGPQLPETKLEMTRRILELTVKMQELAEADEPDMNSFEELLQQRQDIMNGIDELDIKLRELTGGRLSEKISEEIKSILQKAEELDRINVARVSELLEGCRKNIKKINDSRKSRNLYGTKTPDSAGTFIDKRE